MRARMLGPSIGRPRRAAATLSGRPPRSHGGGRAAVHLRSARTRSGGRQPRLSTWRALDGFQGITFAHCYERALSPARGRTEPQSPVRHRRAPNRRSRGVMDRGEGVREWVVGAAFGPARQVSMRALRAGRQWAPGLRSGRVLSAADTPVDPGWPCFTRRPRHRQRIDGHLDDPLGVVEPDALTVLEWRLYHLIDGALLLAPPMPSTRRSLAWLASSTSGPRRRASTGGPAGAAGVKVRPVDRAAPLRGRRRVGRGAWSRAVDRCRSVAARRSDLDRAAGDAPGGHRRQSPP
jgi:hypothetical protein